MFKVDVIAIGKAKKGPWYELQEEYRGRMRWDLTLHELESKLTDEKEQQKEEQRLILSKLDEDSFVIVLDERGEGLRSLDFAQTVQKIQNTGTNKITFLIGGACGFTDEVRDKANMLMSFGQQTWPHMMARIMLLEQVYRAQQILAGHPYHREG